MASTPALTSILQHTPPWVWGLLAVLVAIGLTQSVPRRVGLRRALLLPAAMLAWSLWSVAAAFASAVALVAWAFGVAAAASACVRLGAPAGARWSAAEAGFQMPASWLPLGLMLALFGLKFALGVALALRPELHADAALAGVASLAFGAFSGVFAGRAVALLRLVPRKALVRAA